MTGPAVALGVVERPSDFSPGAVAP